MDMPKPKRLGLVLAGGGARGAFQFGVLQAFSDRRMHFDVVAGTSVGALNAALWSCKRLEEGERFWREVSYQAVYPPRLKVLRRLPAKFYYRLMVATLAISLLWGALRRQPFVPDLERFRKAFARTNSILIGAAASLAWSAAAFKTLGYQEALPGLILGPFIGLLLFEMQTKQGGGGTTRSYFFRSIFVLIVLSVCLMFAGQFVPMAIMALTVAGLVLASRLARSAFLDSKPLLAAINEILGNATPTVPTYATGAREAAVYDPLTCRFERTLPNMGPGGSDFSDVVVRHEPLTEKRWIPKYFQLEALSDSGANNYRLLASAALPFGVVQGVVIDDVKYVDGGVCDNEPLLPLLSHDLDAIFVVLLKPITNVTETRTSIIATAVENYRNSMLAALPLPSDVHCKTADLHRELAAHSGLRPYAEVPAAKQMRPTKKIPQVLLIAPVEPLGGFFDGVLKFDSEFCSKLIDEGRARAHMVLSKPTA